MKHTKKSPVRTWIIEGRDAGGPVAWRVELPFFQYSERQMEELLRLLVARAELTFDEICDQPVASDQIGQTCSRYTAKRSHMPSAAVPGGGLMRECALCDRNCARPHSLTHVA